MSAPISKQMWSLKLLEQRFPVANTQERKSNEKPEDLKKQRWDNDVQLRKWRRRKRFKDQTQDIKKKYKKKENQKRDRSTQGQPKTFGNKIRNETSTTSTPSPLLILSSSYCSNIFPPFSASSLPLIETGNFHCSQYSCKTKTALIIKVYIREIHKRSCRLRLFYFCFYEIFPAYDVD